MNQPVQSLIPFGDCSAQQLKLWNQVGFDLIKFFIRGSSSLPLLLLGISNLIVNINFTRSSSSSSSAMQCCCLNSRRRHRRRCRRKQQQHRSVNRRRCAVISFPLVLFCSLFFWCLLMLLLLFCCCRCQWTVRWSNSLFKGKLKPRWG